MSKFFLAVTFMLLVACAAFAAPFEAVILEGDVEIRVESSQEAVDLARDFDLAVSVTQPAGVEVSLPDLTAMRGRFQGFSLAEGYERERETIDGGKVRREFRWRLIPTPAAPKYRLRPFAVETRPLSGAKGASLATKPVVFPSVPLDAAADGDVEIDPKPYRMPPSRRVVARWILQVAICVVMVAALVFLALKVRRAAKLMMMTPSERAMAELDALIGRNLPGKGLFKDFYVELTQVVRRYIERAHGLKAPMQTTEEFLAAAGAHPDFTPETLASLSDFLKSADLVKFAGVDSSADVADDATRFARSYIRSDDEAMRRAAREATSSGAGKTLKAAAEGRGI